MRMMLGGRSRFAVGGDRLDCGEDWLRGRNAAEIGAIGSDGLIADLEAVQA